MPEGPCPVLHAALKVIDCPPVVEGSLQLGAVRKPFPLKHFRLQAVVKTLQLALRLWIIRPGMTDPDTQAHQPQLQCRPGAGRVAPVRTIIHRHPVRQTISLKHTNQLLLHGLASFISAVRQTQGKTGVVVEQGERMAAAATEGEVALKIHLPEPVRSRMLKPARRRNSRSKAGQQVMTGHQGVVSTEGRHGVSTVFQPALNFGVPQLS